MASFTTIRRKVLSTFLPFVLVILVVIAVHNFFDLRFIYAENYKYIKTDVERNVVKQFLLVDAGYRMFESRIEVELAKHNNIFLDAYTAANGDIEKIDLKAVQTSIGDTLVLYVIDSNAVIIKTTDSKAIGFDFNTLGLGDKIQKIRKGNQIAYERAVVNVLHGTLGMYSYLPTPDHKYVLEVGYGSKGMADMVAAMNLFTITKELKKSSPLISDIRIFDMLGGELADPNDNKTYRLNSIDKQLSERVVREKSLSIDSAGIEKTYLFIDIASIKEGIVNPNKIIEITYDSSKIQAALQKNLLLNGLYIVLAIGIVVWVVWAMAHRLTRPIENLQRTAELITRNKDYSLPIEILSRDEVGQLATSFAEMMRTIRESHDRLEELVQERTAQLQETVEELNQINEELHSTVETVQVQNHEINRKNQDITASINYALRIQKATLPTIEHFNSIFNGFVFMRPRDIVSGDFYWIDKIVHEDNSYTRILIVADCTGHGVPGALMSVIGINLLNTIIKDKNITRVHEVLNALQSAVTRVLGQNSNDGMDIALVSIKSDSYDNVVDAEYAGAMNPLYLFQENKFTEIKADKMSISYSSRKRESFNSYRIPLSENKPSMLYLFSDGYKDQFGGPENRKIMVKGFKEILSQIHTASFDEQALQLEQKFNQWLSSAKIPEPQTDDVIVVGIQL